MIDLNIDMRQYDCPFIDTTDDVDVAFSAVQWQLDTSAEELETRLVVRGDSRDSLEVGLRELRDHRNMRACSVLSKRDNVANISTTIEQTDAMKTIQRNGGYITGPFQIEDGSETEPAPQQVVGGMGQREEGRPDRRHEQQPEPVRADGFASAGVLEGEPQKERAEPGQSDPDERFGERPPRRIEDQESTAVGERRHRLDRKGDREPGRAGVPAILGEIPNQGQAPDAGGQRAQHDRPPV